MERKAISTTSTTLPSPTTASSAEVDPLAFIDAELAELPVYTEPTVAGKTQTNPAAGGSSGQPSGSGGSPATPNQPSAPGVPGGYTGFLGTIGIDEVLYGAPASVPVAASGTAPLTGLPGSVPNRRAVVVKVDNSSKARPQSGLTNADVVFEEQVEWGITRLAAVYHSTPSVVGPVRSGRTTDISFINSLGGPALAYSGANDIIDALLLRQTTVVNYSAARSNGYWRDNSRSAPSNLYTDTNSFSHNGSSPPAQFAYGATNGGAATSKVSVNYPSTKVRWNWNGSGWARTQDGSAHTVDTGQQITVANVVVVVVPEVGTSMVDSAGGDVPEYVFAGSGPASVFVDGKRVDGTWTRPTLRDPAILVDGNGQVIQLSPGRTWVQLVVSGAYSSS